MPISDSHAYYCTWHVYYSSLNLGSSYVSAKKLYLKSYHALSNGSDSGDDGASVGANANIDARSESLQLRFGEESLYDGCSCLNFVFDQ